MADFFQKFKDIKGEISKKVEEQLENKLIFNSNKIDLSKVLQKLLNGEKFEIEFPTDDFKVYQAIYEKGDERLKRLGFCPSRGEAVHGQNNKIIYGFTVSYPEYLILKHIENKQLMNRILSEGERNPTFLRKEDAYLFNALLRNQKSPITEEQAKYLERIHNNLESNKEYFLVRSLINDLNAFKAKEKLEYWDKSKTRHNECHFSYSELEQDAEERAKTIIQLLEKDPIILRGTTCCGTINPKHYLKGDWFALLEGATIMRDFYGRERCSLVRYFVLEKLDQKFEMPRDYVEKQMGLKKAELHELNDMQLAAIINRAYRIESGRKPLEL